MNHSSNSQLFLKIAPLLLGLMLMLRSSDSLGGPGIPTVPGTFYGPVASSVNGHAYYILPPDNWSNVQTAAVALGGNLATVRSAAENAWLVTNMLVLTCIARR